LLGEAAAVGFEVAVQAFAALAFFAGAAGLKVEALIFEEIVGHGGGYWGLL